MVSKSKIVPCLSLLTEGCIAAKVQETDQSHNHTAGYVCLKWNIELRVDLEDLAFKVNKLPNRTAGGYLA